MNQLQVNIPYQHKHSRLSVLLRPILIIPIISIMFMMLSPNLQIKFSDITGMIQGQTEQNNRYNSYHEVRDGDGGIHTNMLTISTKDISDITETITSQSPYIQTMIAVLSYILIAPIVAFMLWSMYIVNIPVIFTLLFRKKYPDWWFSWNQSLQSFVLRIYCYALFLTDQYPSLESKNSMIQMHLPNPQEQDLSRGMPLIKWLLILPYLLIYFVFLGIALLLAPVTYLAILITGRLPRFIHWYQVAVIKFYLGIASYSILFVTDKYPKFIFKG